MEKNKPMNIQLFAESGNNLSSMPNALNDKQIEKQLLKRLLPTLRAYKDAQKSVLKLNAGTTIQWTRFDAIPDDESKDPKIATEGALPENAEFKPSIVEATVSQYGRSISLTDVLLARGIHKCKVEAAELLREYGRKLIDTLTIKAMSDTKNADGTANDKAKVYYGKSKTLANITKSDVIDALIIEKAFVYLSDNDAPKFDDGTYHMLITPKQASDVRKIQSFIDKSKYQDPKGRGFKSGEIGRLSGFTFIESTNIPTMKGAEVTAGKDDGIVCHQMFAYGKDAYGVVDVEENSSKGNPKLYWKDLGSAGTADPANQKATYAMKFSFAAKVLDEKRICRLVAPVSIDLTK